MKRKIARDQTFAIPETKQQQLETEQEPMFLVAVDFADTLKCPATLFNVGIIKDKTFYGLTVQIAFAKDTPDELPGKRH